MTLRQSLLLACAALCTTGLWAQDNLTGSSHDNEGKETFHPHWTLQLQGGISETRGEVSFKDLLSPAVAGYIGYRFTPVVGLRVGASAFEAKGSWVAPHNVYKYNYVQGNVDAVFDLSALFCKYNAHRVFNLYGFVGAGANCGFKNDEAGSLVNAGYPLQYYWSGHRFSPVGRAGLGVNLRVSKHVAINIEGNANILSDHYNSKKAGNPDWQFNLLGGLTFSLGKTSTPAPVPVIPMQNEEEEPVTQPVAAEEQPVQQTQEVEQTKQLKENIFFRINSSTVRTTEMNKVESMVTFLKDNPNAKVVITSYADAATGTASINRRISKLRSLSVANALIKRGIDASRITTEYKGDTVQPFSKVEENRVSICVAE